MEKSLEKGKNGTIKKKMSVTAKSKPRQCPLDGV